MVKDGVSSSWKGQRATRARPFFLRWIPRSAMIALSSFAALMRSIPAFVTCMSPLLLADRFEGQVLEASHLGLQEPEIHVRGTAVVVALRFHRGRAGDLEEGHPPAVRPPDLDLLELAT